MLTRDIYRDFYEEPRPTFAQKLALAGKRGGIALASAALVLGIADLSGAYSSSKDRSLAETARTRTASGTHNKPSVAPAVVPRIAVASSAESVRIAIPPDFLKPRPAVTPSLVDELASAPNKNAVTIAMTTPAAAAPPLAEFAAPPEPAASLAGIKKIPSQMDSASIAQASLTPADRVQTASLTVEAPKLEPAQPINHPAKPEVAPPPASAPMAVLAPITVPLRKVPLPRVAPPLSPADRLHLRGKDYARAERCLANAIYFEARSESVRGQMAVAQVVVNRAFSGFYPDDICGVVYQNANRHLACQFTFACDGKSKLITERGNWAIANRIARQTLDGQIYVPEVGKSTHYHAAYVRPSWAREMRRLVRFGVHSFYRPYAWGNGKEEPVWGSAATLVKVHKTASR